MLSKLKKKIKQDGMAKVTSDLGYRSINTVKLWVKNKRIPNTAKNTVKDYLK